MQFELYVLYQDLHIAIVKSGMKPLVVQSRDAAAVRPGGSALLKH